jgi:hypothetical protein|tara:strand:+ start:426 stop:560 length:135 start_codon:yes stop_codon:yes gene_type:complete
MVDQAQEARKDSIFENVSQAEAEFSHPTSPQYMEGRHSPEKFRL